MNVLTLIVLVAGLLAEPETETATPDPSRRYSEIEALVRGGQVDKAEGMLRDSDFPEGARARLEGLIAMQRGQYRAAVRAFGQALETRPDDAALRLYLAQSWLELDDPKQALEALEGTEALGREQVAQSLLKARALLGLERVDEAYRTLVVAARRFEDEPGPVLDLLALTAGEELYDAARGWAREVVKRHGAEGPPAEVVLAILQALYADPRSLPLLESLALLHPEEPQVVAHLAHAYAADEQWWVAGTLFEKATLLGGSYAFEAADQFRMAGDTGRALHANARVEDPRRRLDQRVAILFSGREMARLVALEGLLEREKLATPQNRYALAYAHYSLGNFARAAQLARGLASTSHADQGRALLRAMGRNAEANDRAP